MGRCRMAWVRWLSGSVWAEAAAVVDAVGADAASEDLVVLPVEH